MSHPLAHVELARDAELVRRHAVLPARARHRGAATVLDPTDIRAVGAAGAQRLHGHLERREAALVRDRVARRDPWPAHADPDAAHRLAAVVVDGPDEELIKGELRDDLGVDDREREL